MKAVLLAAHLGYGGAERVLSSLSCGLPATVEQVLVLFENRVEYPHRARLIDLGLPTTSLAPPARALRFAQRLVRLRDVLARERPDVTVSFLDEPNVLNALLSRNPVLTVHAHLAMNHTRLSGMILRALIPRLYRRGRVVAVSEGVRSELVRTFGLDPARVEAIPNPVALERIEQSLRAPRPSPPSAPQVVNCGRLSPEKGHALLIRAFARVRRRLGCRLLLVGDGPERPRLKALAAELGVAGDVVFAGWQADPFPAIAESRVFAQASRYEGFGIALVEALACGTPVVATDCRYGPREILAPGTGSEPRAKAVEWAEYGALVAPGREESMAEAIGELLEKPERARRYASAGPRRARDFDDARFTQRYLAVLAPEAAA